MKTVTVGFANPYQAGEAYRVNELVLYGGYLRRVTTALAKGSTATGTEFGDLVSFADVVLTGSPTAPTPTTGDNSTAVSTTAFVQTAVGLAITGVVKDRGNFDASGNVFPSTGGSGTAGAIKKGDLWYISVAGTLGGVAVNIGDTIRALADAPGQTAGNWAQIEGNLGYVPENQANKSTDATIASPSNTTYLTSLAIKTYVDSPKSSVWRAVDGTDTSKKLALDVSGVATATTRTLTMPNANVNLGMVPTSLAISGGQLVQTGTDGTTLAVSLANNNPLPLTASTTLVAGKSYYIDPLFTSGTLTLPSSPPDGTEIYIEDSLPFAGTTQFGSGHTFTLFSATDQIRYTSTYSINLLYLVTFPDFRLRLKYSSVGTIWSTQIQSRGLFPGATIDLYTKIYNTDANPANGYSVNLRCTGITANRTAFFPNANVNFGDLAYIPAKNSVAGTVSNGGAICAGNTNIASGTGSSFVGAGTSNTASGQKSIVGSGDQNTASGTYAVIGGGQLNVNSGTYNFTGGGWTNLTNSTNYGVIGGGYNNQINDLAPTNGSDYSVVAGGYSNKSNAMYSAIGGGRQNLINISTADAHSVIAGGYLNTVTGRKSAILGGQSNSIASFSGTILSVSTCSLTANANYAAILAGSNHTLDAEGAAILAGIRVQTINAKYATMQGSGYDGITAQHSYSVTQLLQGKSTSATPIYLNTDHSNATAAKTDNTVPHTCLPTLVSLYTSARHVIDVQVVNPSTGDIAIGKIISRWKFDGIGTYTKLGSDTVTAEFEDAALVGTIAAVVTSSNTGRLNVKVTGLAATTLLWASSVTSVYNGN